MSGAYPSYETFKEDLPDKAQQEVSNRGIFGPAEYIQRKDDKGIRDIFRWGNFMYKDEIMK